jgi:hypothetical protein
MKAKLGTAILLLLAMSLLITASGSWAQTGNGTSELRALVTTLTGILVVNDSNVSKWGLVAGPELYSLQGDAKSFRKYERRRVTITGTITGKRVAVDSIAADEFTDGQIRSLIEELKSHGWTGPKNFTNPTHWIFDFTSPMLHILQAGSGAQNVLLQYLDDREIKDQVVILLGGVGDERAVEPIIEAMVDSESRPNDEAKKINLAANLALTNITQCEVIWHHGGGISIDHCPEDPKSCWYAWWSQNRDNFKVSTEAGNRNYSNYPNYGIYQQP